MGVKLRMQLRALSMMHVNKCPQKAPLGQWVVLNWEASHLRSSHGCAGPPGLHVIREALCAADACPHAHGRRQCMWM